MVLAPPQLEHRERKDTVRVAQAAALRHQEGGEHPGRAPGDPDFRTGLTGGVWSGLLGPVVSWVLAIIFAIWLCRQPKLDRRTWVIAAFAIANGLVRAVPNAIVLFWALRGYIVTEDEVHWGLWYIGKIARPDLGLEGTLALVPTQPGILLAYPAIWVHWLPA